MPASTGIQPINSPAALAALPNNAARVQAVIDLIPDPDTTSTSGAQAAPNVGGIQGNANNCLDEMSPAACTQLRVDLAALKASLT